MQRPWRRPRGAAAGAAAAGRAEAHLAGGGAGAWRGWAGPAAGWASSAGCAAGRRSAGGTVRTLRRSGEEEVGPGAEEAPTVLTCACLPALARLSKTQTSATSVFIGPLVSASRSLCWALGYGNLLWTLSDFSCCTRVGYSSQNGLQAPA